jgi:HEPN domain-containing protein
MTIMDRSGDWLKQAKRDLQKAKLDVEHGFYEWACFASQQAGEKAVKAVYQSLNSSVRGHSILKMIQGLEDHWDIFDYLHAARILDRYYIEARYPNGFPEGSPSDYFDEKIAQGAYDAADKILRFCADIISRIRSTD